MKVRIRREHWSLMVVLTVLVLPMASAGAWVYAKHQAAEKMLMDLAPKYARLLGLEQQKTQLEKALAQADGIASRYAYPASMDATQAGNDAQRRIREIFAKAGVDVVSSQVRPAKAEKQFDRIPITFVFDGEMVTLQSVLVILAGESKPAILLEGFSMQVQPSAKTPGVPHLSGQLNLQVLRSQQ